MSISTAWKKLSANFIQTKSATSNSAGYLSAGSTAEVLSDPSLGRKKKNCICEESQSWLYVTPDDFLL